MALARVKVWIDGEILEASDLNTEFNNILNTPMSLISPLTGTLAVAANVITLDTDADTTITADTDDRIDFAAGGVDVLRIDGTTASTVNCLDIIGTVTANPVRIMVRGTADKGIRFDAADAEEMLILAATTDAVNEITITSAATGLYPTISCTGEADTGIDFENSEGEEILILNAVATAVNEITISNAATGANPTIACTGESDIGITLQNQDAEPMLVLDSVATSTNWVTITSAAAAADATITGGAAGADAGLTIAGKGAGTLKLGDVPLVFPDADGAAGNYVMVTDGGGTLSLASNVIGAGNTTTTVFPLPRAYLAGLQMTRTDANTITIAAGECRSAANDANIVLAASLAKDIDTTWAAGAGGGLNATDFATGGGDCEASTWYHVFVIENGSGTCDAGFDKDISATNLLADSSYTSYRRIGSVLTSATKDIISFSQHGDEFLWNDSPLDINLTNVAPGARSLNALSTPPGVKTRAHLNAYAFDLSTTDWYVYISSPDANDEVPTNSAAPLATLTGVAEGGEQHPQMNTLYVRTDTSSQVGVRVDASITVDNIRAATLGWIDTRGRDD